MDINREDLKKRYDSLSTDELLQIKISTLTNEAGILFKEELSKRVITASDYKDVKQSQNLLEKDRNRFIKRVIKSVIKVIIPLIISIIIAIYYKYIA